MNLFSCRLRRTRGHATPNVQQDLSAKQPSQCLISRRTYWWHREVAARIHQLTAIAGDDRGRRRQQNTVNLIACPDSTRIQYLTFVVSRSRPIVRVRRRCRSDTYGRPHECPWQQNGRSLEFRIHTQTASAGST